MNWLNLKEPWKVRLRSDGLELQGDEEATELILPDLGTEEREEFFQILSGTMPIKETFQELITQLEQLGFAAVSNQPVNNKPSNATLNSIRKLLVGGEFPISRVYRLNRSASRYPLRENFIFSVRHDMMNHASDTPNKDWANGIDVDPEIAELKAIMEGFERFASGVIDEQLLVRDSYQSLGMSAVHPGDLFAFRQDQYRTHNFPFWPFDRGTQRWWRTVANLESGKTMYVPAEAVYYPQPQHWKPLLGECSSSGVAAHLDENQAILGALYEAIERDAFMLTWLCRLSPKKLSRDLALALDREKIKHMENLGYTVILADISKGITPVVLAIAISDQLRPALVLGSAANLSWQIAISKALNEIEQQLFWNMREEKPDFLTDERDVLSVNDHSALYTSNLHLPKANFLWNQLTEADATESIISNNELDSVIQLIGSQTEKDILIADLTPPDFKDSGIKVVRAMPLGLVPISFGYNREPLALARVDRYSAFSHEQWPKRPFTHPFA